MIPRRLGFASTGRACSSGSGIPYAQCKAWGTHCKLASATTVARASYREQYAPDYSEPAEADSPSDEWKAPPAPVVPFPEAKSLAEWADIFEARVDSLSDRDCSTSLKAVAKVRCFSNCGRTRTRNGIATGDVTFVIDTVCLNRSSSLRLRWPQLGVRVAPGAQLPHTTLC